MSQYRLPYRPLESGFQRYLCFEHIANLILPLEYEHEVETSQGDVELVECYLVRGPIVPETYIALSYCWGNKEDTARIKLNGRVLDVQENLVNALSVLQRERPDEKLWIDALCINQEDETEKSREVARMKDIYQDAGEVIAWLGPSKDGSDQLMDQITKFSAFFTSADPGTEVNPYGLDIMPYYGWLLTEDGQQRTRAGTRMHYLAHLKISDDDGANFSKTALESFLNRSWWRRFWIIQEFSLARRLHFFCGERYISRHEFTQLWQTLEARKYGLSYLHAVVSKNSDSYYHIQMDYDFHHGPPTRPNQMMWIWQALRDGKSLMIENVLLSVTGKLYPQEGFESTDPRDRVYSLLGLSAYHDIQPDYSKPVQEVFTEFAQRTLQMGYIELLVYTQFPKRVEGMSTWVPDWSATTTRTLAHGHRLHGSLLLEQEPQIPVPPAVVERPQVTFAMGTNGTLELGITGSFLATLKCVFASYEELRQLAYDIDPARHDISQRYTYSETRQRINAKNNMIFNQLTEQVEQSCLLDCIECSQASHKPTKEMISRTLNSREDWAEEKERPPSAQDYIRCYELMKQSGNLFNTEEEPLAAAYRDNLFDANWKLRVFSTSNGMLGSGSLGIKAGDMVFRLDSCDIPFILRPTNADRFTFIGECYVCPVRLFEAKSEELMHLRIA